MKYSKKKDILIDKSKDKIIFFIHGIFGTPVEFTEFINRYKNEDYSIYGIKLLPRSLNAKDYHNLDCDEWQHQVSQKINELTRTYKEVNVICHSLGCLLALRANNINNVNKLVLWAPAIKKKVSFTAIKVGLELGNNEYYKKLNEYAGVRNASILDKVRLLRCTMYLFPAGKAAIKALPSITTDTLVICSKKDESVSVKSGKIIMDNINSTHKELITLKHSYHNTFDTQEEFIYDTVLDFINEKSA